MGLRKTSTVDYPGLLAAVLFFPGCNLRCPWCQNRELVDPAAVADGHEARLPVADTLAFLEKRRNVLRGVVLSGGEPTLYVGLGEIARRIKAMGYALKLDTNGTRPRALRSLCSDPGSRPDYIAVDLKVPPAEYGRLRFPGGDGEEGTGEALIEGCRIPGEFGIDHEYRTLALPGGIPDDGGLAEMARCVDTAPWYFSSFKGGNCLDDDWNALAEPGEQEARRLAETARALGKQGMTRRLGPP